MQKWRKRRNREEGKRRGRKEEKRVSCFIKEERVKGIKEK